MNSFEVLSIMVSVIAIIVSIIALRDSRNATNLAKGDIELYINERITSTKDRVIDMSLKLVTALAPDEQREAFQHNLRVAVENNLNAYEEACSKYLDGKVDKERFKKTYHTEIRQIVEDQNHKHYFDANTSRYKAILRVYREWNDFEK